MYVGKATGKASIASVGRIVFTAILSPVFCLMGLLGPIWAAVGLTLPVALECLMSENLPDYFLNALISKIDFHR